MRSRERDAEPGDAAAPDFEVEVERARALERSGAFEAALDAYSELARSTPTRREPLQGLRRLYAERGSWDAVLQVAELEIGLLAQPEERARLLTQMARIWERELGESGQAQQLLARAREERSRSTATPAAAAALSGQTLVQRAWIAAARGDSQAALSALQGALSADPSDVEALDMMLTVLEGAERYAEMSDLLERRASLAADSPTRAVVLARLGALREAHQSDLGGASSAYERALEADPANRAARSALQRIYRRSESWGSLRSLLESSTGVGTREDRAAAYVALAALLERQLGDSQAAEAAYTAALELIPDDTDAQAGLARLRGERRRGGGPRRGEAPAAAKPQPAQPAAPERSSRTAARVEGEARAEGDAASAPHTPSVNDDLAALLPLLRLNLLRSPAEQELALQRELSELLLGSRSHAIALPHARRAAALAPRDPAQLEAALTAARASGGAYAALDLLDDLLATAPDLATRAQLLALRGDALQNDLGWTEEAMQSWREALEADPRHAAARARLAGA